MSLLSSWESEYANEIYKHLTEREQDRKKFMARSPNIANRNDLLDKLDHLCDKYKLSVTVQHLAIYILDFFMDNHKIIGNDSLELVMLSSLRVAAKVDENDAYIPRMKSLLRISQHDFPSKDIVDMESKILTFFQWQFLIPTCATYLDYLCARCFSEDDFKWKNIAAKRGIEVDILYKQFEREMIKSLQVSIDLKYYQFLPSQVAASCLYCVRSRYIEPAWTYQLENVTGYSRDDLKECITMLISDMGDTYSPTRDVYGDDGGLLDVNQNQVKNRNQLNLVIKIRE